MKLDKLIRMQKPTRNLVHRTKSSMPKGDTVNPYAPFEGLDGLTYQISYPDELNETTNCYAFALGLRAKGDPQRDYIPGFLAGYNGLPKDGTELEARVVADIEKLGRKVLEVIHASDIPEHLPKAKVGTVWIKALVGECIEGDIHFMVKNIQSPNQERFLWRQGTALVSMGYQQLHWLYLHLLKPINIHLKI